MSLKVALFDFHFTLARCDCQLDVETRNLPDKLIDRLVQEELVPVTAVRGLRQQANDYYQEIRKEMYHGGLSWALVDRALAVLDYLKLGDPAVTYRVPDWISQIMHECLAELTMVPGADVAVQRLAELNYRLGLVSTTGHAPSVEEGLRIVGLRDYFDEIVTSGNERLPKSNPEIYLRAVQRFSVKPEEAVHTGDQVWTDVHSAKAAGLSAIWFTGLGRESAAYFGVDWDEQREAAEIADAKVNDLYELPGVIDRLRKGVKSKGA